MKKSRALVPFTPKPVKLQTAVRLIRELRIHHKKVAQAPSNIRIASNKDRRMVQAAAWGRVLAFEAVLRILERVDQ